MTIQIAINDQPVAFVPADDSTVAHVIESLCRDHIAPTDVLSTIVIDGHFWRNEWDAHLGELSASEVSTLQVYSQSPDEAARVGLEELDEVIQVIETNLGDSAKAFRFAQMDEALNTFIQGAGLLKDALQFLQLYLSHTGARAQSPSLVRLAALDADLSGVLDELTEAQQTGDWGLVADLIEYELLPRACELSFVVPRGDAASASRAS